MKLSQHQTSDSNDTFSLSPVNLAIRTSIVGLGLAHGAAQAATITVTSHLDNNSIIVVAGCGLREAIASANNEVSLGNGCTPGSSSGTDTITFSNSLVSNTISLIGGELEIDTKNIEISASTVNGGITIDANNASRVLNITTATVSLVDLAITGGSDPAGGGIYLSSSANVSLNNCTVSGNSAAAGNGGGIYAGIRGSVSLNNSRVSGNSADFAGGGIFAFAATIGLNNSTVSDNSAISSGGGIFAFNTRLDSIDSTLTRNFAELGGGIYATSFTIVNSNSSTVSGNSAAFGGGIFANESTNVNLNNSTVSTNAVISRGVGGGILAFAATISLSNSTVSDNFSNFTGGIAIDSSSVSMSNSIVANSFGGDCKSTDSTVTLDSATIIEDGSCHTSRSGDPGLLPLTDNGGITQTNALKSNSIARNSSVGICPAKDQRDQTRDLSDGFCDVGAIEFNANDVGAVDDSSFYVIPLDNGKVVVIPL